MLPLRAADPKELDALLKKQVELKKDDRIVFLGDSLTFLGGKEEPKQHVTKGFVRIVKEALNEKHPDKHIDCDWVSTGGGTVQTLLTLLDKAPVKKPTIVVIQIGCNDARQHTREIQGGARRASTTS
jgi:lysophospholipase L1-like esterase